MKPAGISDANIQISNTQGRTELDKTRTAVPVQLVNGGQHRRNIVPLETVLTTLPTIESDDKSQVSSTRSILYMQRRQEAARQPEADKTLLRVPNVGLGRDFRNKDGFKA